MPGPAVGQARPSPAMCWRQRSWRFAPAMMATRPIHADADEGAASGAVRHDATDCGTRPSFWAARQAVPALAATPASPDSRYPTANEPVARREPRPRSVGRIDGTVAREEETPPGSRRGLAIAAGDKHGAHELPCQEVATRGVVGTRIGSDMMLAFRRSGLPSVERRRNPIRARRAPSALASAEGPGCPIAARWSTPTSPRG